MIYWLLHGIIKVFFLLYNRLSIEGRNNIEMDGQYIFAANHSSAIDVLVMIAVLRQPLFVPYKTGFFPKPIEKCLFQIVRGAPIKNDTICKDSFKSIIWNIEQGRSLIISPEGTRSADGKLQKFRDGASRIAFRTGIPIVPVALINTDRALPLGKIFLRPEKIKVIIGTPINSDFTVYNKNKISEYTQTTRNAVLSLLNKEERNA